MSLSSLRRLASSPLLVAVLGLSACGAPGAAPVPALPRAVLAGAWIDASGVQRPAAWIEGSFVDLSSSLPEGNRGGVVTAVDTVGRFPRYTGSFVAASGECRLFSLGRRGFLDLGSLPVIIPAPSPGAPRSEAPLIGSEERGTGFVEAGEGIHTPCYWLKGRRFELGLPGLDPVRGGQGRALVTAGKRAWVGGFFYDADFAQRPCAWDGPILLDLSSTLPAGSRGGVVNALALL